ncbi:MAG: acyl-CoA dehydrogenase family protein, partial [Cyanobacteria bacterium P01_G01_bin.49]
DRRGISQGRQQGDHNGGWQKAEEKKFKDNSKNSYHLKEPIIYTLNSAALQENRVVVTTPNSAKTQPIVSCGQSSLNEKVIIVDPDTLLPCSPEKVGEIWVSGASITQGYWKQPQSTQDTFRAYLADTGEGPFLRTGDLGFLHNEELFVTGRLKDVIIIRGHNYYPQDIELTVASSHPALRPHSCVATNITFEEEEKLVIILEIKKKSVGKLDLKEFIATIRSNISQNHGIQTDTIVLVKQGSIPKTSSGKLQRQACKKAYVENHLQVIESWQAVDDLLPYIPLKPHLPSDFSPLIKGGGLSPAIVTNLIQWLREYANEQINSRLIDERRCIPPSIVLDFGNQGLLGMQVPSEYGGLGLNHTDTMRIIEQLGAIDTTLSLFVGLNNILGIRPLLHFGSQSLKEELLPRLATGRELAAFALTEPGAGSNPQAIAASAISQSPDNWVLNGTKIWSGSAAWAGIINVFVQEQDNQGKFQGMSGFVIRKGTPGLRQGPEALTMGMRGMVQNTVYFENVAVNSSQRLGNLGDGMKVAQDAMMYGRLAIAAASVGGMKRCAQLWHRYSSRRTISTGRLLDNPLVLARLNGLTTAITTVEILVTTITQLLDQEKEVPIEAYTVCKVAAPEFYWQAADSLVQFLGGRGYIETNIAPQILRDARVLRIFEGPTETLTAFLGSRVIYQRQELKQFLCQTLRVPDVYQQLKESVQKIQDYYNSSRSPFSDAAKTRQWTAMQCGEVAMWGILLAALQSKALSTKAESLERAITWTQEHFQQKIAQAFSKNPDALIVTNAKKTSEFIVDYETAIGDLEQTLAGEDRELDELLRKQADLEIGELGRLGDWETGETRGTIEDWLMNWLGNKLKISGQSIDPSRAFADYGIDSVMAVELAQDLQEWLAYPQELEASLAWNFPTIRALAKYLSSRLDRSISDEQADSSTSIESEMLSAIKDCSEDEVQAAITQEMTELESLLKGGYR